MSNFFTRTLTAAAIVVFVLGGFWLHPISFFLTGLTILAGAQYEYYRMAKNSGRNPQTTGGLVAGIALYSISTLVAAGIIQVVYYLAMVPVITIIMILELYRKEENPFDNLAHTLLPLIYIVIPLSMLPFSAFSRTGLSSLLPHGNMIFSPGVAVGFFLILWANDTGAYITGILFGRHRLLERISPKKSWEGVFGGAVIALIAAWLLSTFMGVVSSAGWVVIAIVISVAGTFGDLIESMLKRSMGVKDSGAIMPGHGGFLDRFDSTLLSFPLVYLFISLFG